MYPHWFASFKSDERGSATVETLFMVPLFAFLLVLITDVSFIFYGKAQALRIIQNANRAFSVRPDITEQQTAATVLAGLQAYSAGATAKTTVGDDGVITTIGTLKASELMSIGSIPGFSDKTITVTAQHFKEY